MKTFFSKAEMNVSIFDGVCKLLEQHGLSKNHLRAKRQTRRTMPGGGVYFLFKGEEIVYVGRSINILNRLGAHDGEGSKDWDSFACVSCDEKYHGVTEALFIAAYQPRYNKESRALQ